MRISPQPPRRSSQSILELLLMIILIAIVLLSIFLIMGDGIRELVNDLLLNWFPAQPETG